MKPLNHYRLVHKKTGQLVMHDEVGAYTKGEARAVLKEMGKFGKRLPATMKVIDIGGIVAEKADA